MPISIDLYVTFCGQFGIKTSWGRGNYTLDITTLKKLNITFGKVRGMQLSSIQ